MKGNPDRRRVPFFRFFGPWVPFGSRRIFVVVSVVVIREEKASETPAIRQLNEMALRQNVEADIVKRRTEACIILLVLI